MCSKKVCESGSRLDETYDGGGKENICVYCGTTSKLGFDWVICSSRKNQPCIRVYRTPSLTCKPENVDGLEYIWPPPKKDRLDKTVSDPI